MSKWDQDYQDEINRLSLYFQNLCMVWEHDIDYDFQKERPKSLDLVREKAEELYEAIINFKEDVENENMKEEFKHHPFSVYHLNGEKWTNEEMQDYVAEHDYTYLMDYWTFAIDEDGCLYIMDKCGSVEGVKDPDYFVIKFDED